MARSGQIQQLLGEDFAVHHILPSGDCFYDAVAYSLSTDEQDDENPTPTRTPSDLRAIVANSLTEETMELFRMTHEAGVCGFEFMRKTSDLDTLKERHLVSGRDTGAGSCIWANDYAIQTIATRLRVCLHIMDEESGRARSARGGSNGGDSSNRSGSSKRRRVGTFVTIRPETAGAIGDDDRDNDDGQEESWRHIILQRTRRQHYNLIVQRLSNGEGDERNNGKQKKTGKNDASERAIFPTGSLSQRIQELWGIGL
jgi:hypothetical protein